MCEITPLHIPTKTYHYEKVQYNDICFNSGLCELLLVINISLPCPCVNLGASDEHTSVSAQVYKRGTLACTHNPVWTSDSHTLPSSPSSLFHSVKTDVHTDRPSLHPSARQGGGGSRGCPSTTTVPASQHTTKTKTPRWAQQCVILRLTTPSFSQGQGSIHLSHRRAAALGHHQTKGWEWLLSKHVLLLHTTGDGICCSYLN